MSPRQSPLTEQSLHGLKVRHLRLKSEPCFTATAGVSAGADHDTTWQFTLIQNTFKKGCLLESLWINWKMLQILSDHVKATLQQGMDNTQRYGHWNILNDAVFMSVVVKTTLSKTRMSRDRDKTKTFTGWGRVKTKTLKKFSSDVKVAIEV